MGRMPDQYTIRARVLPALLVTLPLGLATLAWFPDGLSGWGAIWGLVVWSGGTMFLAQIGRDSGKRKEPSLFGRWGGKPTSKLLRHTNASNRPLLERRHGKLNKLTHPLKLPTPEQEASDPRRADEIYEACVTLLRDKTRDRKDFPLVFEENCSYGFRRNLWGLKPLGLTLTVLSLLAVAALPIVDPAVWTTGPKQRIVVPGLIDCLMLLAWVCIVTPRWVRIPGDAYAERLLEACERL